MEDDRKQKPSLPLSRSRLLTAASCVLTINRHHGCLRRTWMRSKSSAVSYATRQRPVTWTGFLGPYKYPEARPHDQSIHNEMIFIQGSELERSACLGSSGRNLRVRISRAGRSYDRRPQHENSRILLRSDGQEN